MYNIVQYFKENSFLKEKLIPSIPVGALFLKSVTARINSYERTDSET